MSSKSSVKRSMSKKASSTSKVAHTTVQCTSTNALVLDDLSRPYVRSPGPVAPPRDYLSFETIGMKPPPSPMPETLKRALKYLKRADSYAEQQCDDQSPLRSPRTLRNLTRANSIDKDINLQAKSTHSPQNEISFNEKLFDLQEVPKHKKRAGKHGVLKHPFEEHR